MLPKTKECILNLEGSWLTIWFNRPDKRNALSENLLKEIKLTLTSIKNNRSVRGVIFRGKGNVFCSGADLKWMKNITSDQNYTSDLAIKMSTKFGEIFEQIHKAPQITISVVEGPCMAGGVGIACATDFLITSIEAKYALTETKIGLTPAQIAPYVINRLGFKQAKQFMLLAKLFNGEKAFEIGMADYLARNENELNSHIISLIEQSKKCAPNAIAVTKKVLSSNNNVNLKKAAKLFSDCILHKEGQEGLASFFEKRKPFWNMDR